MADLLMGPRCTRRKQANPRRKNVELEDMPEEVDLDHLGPGDSIAKDGAVSDTPTTTTTNTAMPSSATTGADCSDERDTGTSKRSLCTNSDNGASKNDFHIVETGSAHKNVRRTLMDSNPSPPKSPSGAQLVPNSHAVIRVGDDAKYHPDDDAKSEEEKIQEYLQRSDTAVIYPEPVDGDPNPSEQTSPPSPKIASIQPIDHSGSLDKRSSISKEDFYLKCPHCDKVYPSLESFRLHLVSQHGAADSSPVLTSVDNSGSGVGGFACDKCSATFAHKSQLEKHEGLHSPTAQVVACKVCNKTFANVYRLQRHMISHDESAVLRKFKCPECEKAFKFKHHLKEHIRIHSGEKPFACPNCGKRFSHSGSYSSHMTSKKCLVMNLKVRRTIDKPNVRGNGVASAGPTGGGGGGGGGRRGSSQGAFTPILPKYGENGLELSPGYGPPPGLSVSDHFAAAGIDFVPPSMQAFLPPPYGLHPLLTGNHHHPHFSNSGLSMYAGLAGPPPPSLATLSHMIRPSAISIKANDDARDLVQNHQLKEPSVPSTTTLSPNPESDDTGKAFRAQSPEESSSSSDLKAVKQILATVNATVSKQQQEMSKLRNGISTFNQNADGDRSSPSPTTSRTESPVCNNNNNGCSITSPHSPNANAINDASVKRNGFRGDDSHCRHCGNSFESKIDLHQHERYLCKMNREIFPVSVKEEMANNNELASYGDNSKGNHAMTNGCSDMDDDPPMSDVEDGGREMGDDGLDSDGRKVRMRSLFSEDQQAVLRSYYEINARPGKEELQRIATEIKFPPRVVQVWFQNMRARDKKRGRALMSCGKDFSTVSFRYGDSSSSSPPLPPPQNQQLVSSQYAKTPFSAISPTSSYGGVTALASRIPHPPIFYPTPSPSPFSLPTAQLRMNGQSSSPPSFAAPPFPLDHEQPLDLSIRSGHKSHANNNSSNNNGNNNLCHSPAASDRSVSEGEVLNLSQKSSRTSTPSKESNNNVNYAAVTTSGALSGLGSHLNHQDHNALLKATEPSAIFKYMMTTPKMELDDLSAGEETPDLIVMRRNFSSSPNTCDTPRLHRILASSPHLDVSSLNGTVDSSGRVYSTDGSHSPCPSDRDDHLEIDEGSDIHRRCWTKTDHGDESQLDLDDSSMGEDDRPLKRRKSWKQHKLDSEDGMYACDQCDKVFSKQSSLARHKYEHSGQRPHKCDVCSKAFKHKHHLTEHKRLHSGEKPFQCKKCLKRFSHSGSYSQHMNHRYSYCKPYRE